LQSLGNWGGGKYFVHSGVNRSFCVQIECKAMKKPCAQNCLEVGIGQRNRYSECE